MITRNHHIPSADKAEVNNVIIQSPENLKCNVHIDKNITGLTCLVVTLVGHCECDNHHFDLRQQQDQAQELGDGNYNIHNH